MSKNKASVDIGHMPFMPILVYTSRALITADLKEVSSHDFKDRYLVPLDNHISESNISGQLLTEDYRYTLGDAMNREHYIEQNFDREIAGTIDRLYCDVGDVDNYIGNPSIVRPLLDQRRIIQPNIIHMSKKSDLDIEYPEIIFGMGVYKSGAYKMTQGFEELKIAIENQIGNLLNRRRLRLQSSGNFLSDREWTPRVIFALVIRKYLYQAFLCGTDRLFI